MSQINRGNIARLTQDGLRNVFGQSYAEHQQQYSQMFDVITSSKAYEVIQEVEGLAVASVKDEGAAIAYDSFGQSFNPKYVPLTYAKGISISEEALDDELYGVFGRKAKAMAFAMTQAKEIVAANVLARAFSSSYTMSGGDGSALCSTSHSNGPHGGTYSNKLSASASLSETSLEDVLIMINNATDARGNKIALKATKLIVTPTNMFQAARLLKSVGRTDTANNDINAIKEMGSIPSMFVSNYITDGAQWYVKTNCADGLTFVQRKVAEFKEDNSFNTGAMRYKATERYAVGWSNSRTLFGSDAP